MSRVILVADDEKNIRDGLKLALEDEGYAVVTASDGMEAWNFINAGSIDLVITDLRMPVLTGAQLLAKIHSSYPALPVIVLTGHGTVEDAVDAMRNGAFDFLTKPVDLNHLMVLLEKCFSNNDLLKENKKLHEEINNMKLANSYTSIIGKSGKILKLLETIQNVAKSNASVLITGESGVGKERVADALVEFSDRKNKPFIKTHLAALNGNLLESELFGHVKGAFTGAVADKKGKFELANGGTVFLDEIGEIDQSVQIKLLRVLQEREFERVGDGKTIKVDVRIIAATNRNLEEEVKKGNFREDLFYRLNVIKLDVPPLRERKEDLFLLANDFLKKFSAEDHKKITSFSQSAKEAMNSYNWPGNVRELQNCVQSAVVMCRTSVIEKEDLPPYVTDYRPSGDEVVIKIGTSMEEASLALMQATLNACGGNKTKAAQMLGIGRKTIIRKLG